MRRFGLVLSPGCACADWSGRAGPTAGTRAQDATPLAGGLPFEIAPGVTADLLPTSQDPPSLYRIRFAPGVTYEIEPVPRDRPRLW